MHREKSKDIISAGILFLAVLFLFVGYNRNEVFTVFQKAVYICLECIGIG